MTAPMHKRKRGPLLTVLTFAIACAVGFGWLWAKTGAGVPGIPDHGYQVSFDTADLKNLRDLGEARIAGVTVGKVAQTNLAGGQAHVVLSLDPQAVPLHQGATARVGVKSLVGSSYVDLIDGKGAPIPNHTTLPPSAVKPAVDVDELFNTLNPDTRQALSGSVRSLGGATVGTQQNFGQLMSGVGVLGQQGHTVLDALAEQSQDLQSLSDKATVLLDTLDTGRGQIATLVQDAQRVTDATSANRTAIQNTVRTLPGLLDTTRVAGGKLGELSQPLAPVAADLHQAAPYLNDALVRLPAATSDLRGLFPDLDKTLGKAPATLDRIPSFGGNVRAMVPGARTLLADVNPMLAYLQPYGRDVGAMFANFADTLDTVNGNGVRTIRLGTIFNPGSVRNVPVPLRLDSLYWTNPYPAPGQAGHPAPFRGSYPHVQREPR